MSNIGKYRHTNKNENACDGVIESIWIFAVILIRHFMEFLILAASLQLFTTFC